jgi:RimJ/RimL family protein N-acetyltransferase
VIPTLETQRLRLREWRFDDFNAYLTLVTDAELQKHVAGGVRSEIQAWDDLCAMTGQWLLRGVGVFLVADRKTDRPLGLSGLWYPPDVSEPELCWSLFPGNTGRGYATEAAIAARLWAYTDRNYPRLVSYVHPLNTASLAVAERLGAALESETRLRGEERLVFRHPDMSLV